MRGTLAILAALTIAGSAHGQPAKKPPRPETPAQAVTRAFEQSLGNTDATATPQFAFTTDDAKVAPPPEDLASDFELGASITKGKGTTGVTADGKAAWVSADLGVFTITCGDETCPRVPKPDTYYHSTMVLQNAGGTWAPLAFAYDEPVTAKSQAEAVAKGANPTEIERQVRKGAEPAVALFEGSIGDPKVLTGTVSTRADVVLYGSEMKERYVGGKKVAAQLARWNLAFRVRDGLQAGVSANGQLAWVAANVDATSLKKKGTKPTPYRALFVYLLEGDRWQLVVVHFSFTR